MRQGEGGGPRPRPNLRLIKGTARGKSNATGSGPRPQSGIPEPPAILSPEALVEWRRVAPELHRLGYLTPLDMAILAAYAQSYARWQTAERRLRQALLTKVGGTTRVHPLAAIARRAQSDMTRYGAEVGLTPLGRQRLAGIEPPQPPDPLSKYFNPPGDGA